MGRDIRINPKLDSIITSEYPEIVFSGLSASTIKLKVEDDGSVVYEGDTGGLFSIEDNKDGLIHSVNDVSGLPIFEVYSYNTLRLGRWNDPGIVVATNSVGIGTASPTERLHVVGGIRYEDGNQQSGYLLTSDVNGVASWASASAIVGTSLGDGNGIYDGNGVVPTSTVVSLTDTLSFDSNLLYLDSTNNRVGVNIVPTLATFDVRTTDTSDEYSIYTLISGTTSAEIPAGIYSRNIKTEALTGNYGIYSETSGSTLLNAGVVSIVSGAGANLTSLTGDVSLLAQVHSFSTASNTYVGSFKNLSSSVTNAYGIDISVKGVNTNNYGLYINVQNGTASNDAIRIISGDVKLGSLQSGAVNGYILQSTDVNGYADWVDPSTLSDGNGIYDGSGTVPTSTSVTLTDSLNFNSGLLVMDSILNNVGIGTATPSTNLHIEGGFRYVDGNQGYGNILTSDVDGNVSWEVPTYAVGTGSVDKITRWSGTNSLTDSGVSLSNTNDISGVNILTVDDKIGIGTATPSTNLHIEGGLRYIDGNQQSGYILTSDGTGVASWTAASSLELGDLFEVENTVYVDATKGSDISGLVERRDKPFQTIESALTALHASSDGDWTINIAPGTYNEVEFITQDFNNYHIKADHRTTINFSGARAFHYTGNVNNDRYITIEGGRWFHNGVQTMFEGYQVNYFKIRNAHIQNNTGTGVFQRFVLQEMDNCTVIGVVGWIFYGAGGSKVDTCFIEAQSDYIYNTAGTIGGFTFTNCSIKSLTAGVGNYIGSGSFGAFNDCYIETSGTVIRARGLSLYMTGFCIVKIINNGSFLQFGGNGAQDGGGRYLQFDTVVINQSNTNGSLSIQTTDDMKVDAFILNKLYIVNPISNGRIVAAGINFTGATVGDDIVFNLPFPYNGNPISYTIATTVVSDEVDAFQALVEAEVTNPASDWYVFTEGLGLSQVERGGNVIRVRGTEQTPGGFSLRFNTNTVTSTLGSATETNLGWQGIFNHGGGDIVTLPNNADPYLVGGTERIIDRLRRYTKFNY